MSLRIRRRVALFPLALLFAAGCSSSSGGGGGGSPDGSCPPSVCGGGCPAVLTTAQVPFSSMPCNALTASDFAAYGAMAPMTSPYNGGTGCNYQMMYKDGSGANVIVNFKPQCQFASDQSFDQSNNNPDGGTGGAEITNYQTVPNLGDAAFYYELAGENNVEVEHGGVVLTLVSSVCNNTGCLGGAMVSTLALAKLVVSRY